MEAPLLLDDLLFAPGGAGCDFGGTVPRERLDRITRLAARALGVPVVFVSVTADGREHVLASCGLALAEAASGTLLSARSAESVRVIGDAREDPRFAADPLVAGGPGLRFVVLAPLKAADGRAIGTLCAADVRPRRTGHALRAGLADLAAFVAEELEQTTRVRAALLASEQRYRTVFDSVREVIFQTDAGGRWQLLNPAWTELTGFSVEESLGRPFLEFVHPDDRAGNVERFEPLVGGEKEVCRHEVRYLRRDGGYRWVEAHARLVRGADGAVAGTSGTLGDITHRKETELALRQSEALLSESQQFIRQVAETTPAILFVYDLFGRQPVYVNRSVERVLGYEQERLRSGRPAFLVSIIHPEDRRLVLRQLTSCASEDAVVTFECRIRHTDGGWRWMRARVVLFNRTGDGRPRQVLGTVEDVTERKEAAEALEKARRAAEESDRAKSAFLANMSHEIRTPLNGVIGMTELLLESELSAEQRDSLEVVRASSDTLLTLINDILDFSKIEAGQVELEHRPFNLRDALESALDLVALQASQKALDLVCQIEAGVPDDVMGDDTRLRQVLLNLLSNAVKFTERGEVVVTVAATALDERRHRLHFAVRDTGIGIPADRMERLFRSFSQVDAATTRKYGGTGLGLAISKRLAELMGGAMQVESAAGRGSCFRFSIVAETRPDASGTRLCGLQPDLAGRRLLVVDDNETNRRVLAGQAECWGMEPVAVSSGDEAVRLVEAGAAFDVAVLDLNMPGMDGVALGRVLRARAGSGFPIVLLSSATRAGSSDLPEAGLFAARLTKPVKMGRLHETLTAVLPGAAVRPAVERAQPASTMPALSMGQQHPLRILLVEDNPVNQQVAHRLLGRIGYGAETAADGAIALDAILRQAAAGEPYDVVFMDVHMPVMDGLECTRAIRDRLDAGQQPWVIGLTANALVGDRERLLAAGMDDYLAKPVRMDALSESLERARRKRPGVEAPAPVERRDGPILNPRVIEELRELMETPEDFRMIIDSYRDNARELLERLRAAHAGEDIGQIAYAAHMFKSSAATVGATQLSKLCATAETAARAGEPGGAFDTVALIEAEAAVVDGELDRLLETGA